MTDVIIAAHDLAPIRETSQSTQPRLNDETQRAVCLIRRLERVFLDLGLDRTVPDGWVEPSIDGLSFSSLTLRQADQLVRALEDLAVDHDPEVPEPGPGQLSLFGDGQ
jgi:hypothetical protein